MAKQIGIAACSAEGSALCCRTICSQAPALMGEYMHPEVTMHTPPLADYMACIRAADWAGVADLMLASARKLAGAGARGFKMLAVTGTNYLMTGPVYPGVLEKTGISCQVPDEHDRARIDAIIFKELANGISREESRLYFNTVVRKMKERGCDAVVLGCTEIPLLVDPAARPPGVAGSSAGR